MKPLMLGGRGKRRPRGNLKLEPFQSGYLQRECSLCIDSIQKRNGLFWVLERFYVLTWAWVVPGYVHMSKLLSCTLMICTLLYVNSISIYLMFLFRTEILIFPSIFFFPFQVQSYSQRMCIGKKIKQNSFLFLE